MSRDCGVSEHQLPDDFWSIPDIAEVVQGDVGVLNHIVQHGGHLVHWIDTLKLHPQRVKAKAIASSTVDLTSSTPRDAVREGMRGFAG